MNIIKMIEEGTKYMKSDKQKKIGTYYASELSKCSRQLYYSYLYETEYEYPTLKAFAVGNALHGLVQNIVGKSIEADTDVTAKNELADIIYKDQDDGFEIHGRTDIFIEAAPPKIIEIKTSSNLSFSPSKDHIEQLNFYMWYFKEKKPEGYLLYLNTAKKMWNDINYAEMKQYKIEYDEYMFESSVNRIRRLNNHFKSRILPEAEAREPLDKKWQCSYCYFKKRCDSDK